MTDSVVAHDTLQGWNRTVPIKAGTPLAFPGEAAMRKLVSRAIGRADRAEAALRKLRARIDELEALASSDPVTGLLNRRGFDREQTRAHARLARYGEPATIIIIDLDRFKTVNDRFGHAAGDAVLAKIGRELRRQVRECDCVARLGGDEFGIVLSNIGLRPARRKAREIAQMLNGLTLEWDGGTAQLAASVGVAAMDVDEVPEMTLIRADKAMYRSKRRRQSVERLSA